MQDSAPPEPRGNPDPRADKAAPWLVVVGIGDDGWEGLGPDGRAAIRSAELLVGGERHLALVPEGEGPGERLAWPRPMRTLVDELLGARRGERICVLASGDPMFYGIGSQFARRLGPGEMAVIPHLSTFAIACARLLWSAPDTTLVTLCGRPVETLHAVLFDGARLVVYSGDGDTPHAVAALLAERGFGASQIAVLEHLGGPREQIHCFASADLGDVVFAGLNAMAIECVASPEADILSTAPGLPDGAFEHDGQITKRDVRAATLARLSPRPGGLLWDIGAGSGAIGIEWMRAARWAHAVGIEARADRAARARANAAKLGVPRLEIVEGRAPAALEGLAQPEAIFVGGGLTESGLLEACWRALGPGGRLVANAVTLETEAVLLAAYDSYGGELVRLAVARAGPVGRFTGWRPAMPVTQWAVTKPWETGDGGP